MLVQADRHQGKAQQGGETRLRERLARAQREGQLAANARVEDLAVMFQSLLAGLGVMAKGGAKRAKLESAIDAAMAVWPEVKAKRNGKAPRRPSSTAQKQTRRAA